jgi:hypothetical protein
MSTLNELLAKAKDDETKALLRQVADLVAMDTRRQLEEAHAVALGERDQQHAAAMKTSNAKVEKLDSKVASLERTVATKAQTIEAMTQTHASAVQQYESQVAKQGKEIARLQSVASNAKGWAWVGGAATTVLGIALSKK